MIPFSDDKTCFYYCRQQVNNLASIRSMVFWIQILFFSYFRTPEFKSKLFKHLEPWSNDFFKFNISPLPSFKIPFDFFLSTKIVKLRNAKIDQILLPPSHSAKLEDFLCKEVIKSKNRAFQIRTLWA